MSPTCRFISDTRRLQIKLVVLHPDDAITVEKHAAADDHVRVDGAQTEMPVLIANLSKDASQALTLPFSSRCNLDAASKTAAIVYEQRAL